MISLRQMAEAFETSVGSLLSKRMSRPAGSSFQRTLDANDDMGKVGGWWSRLTNLFKKATWRDVEDAVSSTTPDASSVQSVVDTAWSTIDSLFSSIGSLKSVKLVDSSGSYSDITSTWSAMQEKAASGTASKEWLEGYTTALASGGVGVSINGGSVQELSSAVRSASTQAAYSSADDIARAAAKEAGYDAVKISAHSCCAPDHLPYQGRIYTLEEFAAVEGSLERPIGRGVMNCRHVLTYCNYADGSDYTEEELAWMAEHSSGLVSFTGRSGRTLTMTWYEASQYARSSELQIRKLKQTSSIKSSAGLDTSKTDSLISTQTEKYKSLLSELDMDYDEDRLRSYTMGDL